MTGESIEEQLPDILARYFAAMRRGSEAEDEMMALFTDDAVYAEPFSGQDAAVGKQAIRERLRAGWEVTLPDLELDVLSIETTVGGATTTWECRSSVFDTPQQGRDTYTLADGLIRRLDVTLTDPDPGS